MTKFKNILNEDGKLIQKKFEMWLIVSMNSAAMFFDKAYADYWGNKPFVAYQIGDLTYSYEDKKIISWRGAKMMEIFNENNYLDKAIPNIPFNVLKIKKTTEVVQDEDVRVIDRDLTEFNRLNETCPSWSLCDCRTFKPRRWACNCSECSKA